jgi:hypothetical protein
MGYEHHVQVVWTNEHYYFTYDSNGRSTLFFVITCTMLRLVLTDQTALFAAQ